MEQATKETSTAKPLESELEEAAPEIPLRLYWDEWGRCMGSRYQRDSLYRTGRLNPCARQWEDLKTAFKAKFYQYNDPSKCKDMMANTFYTKRTTISPTAGSIWELKTKPGWD